MPAHALQPGTFQQSGKAGFERLGDAKKVQGRHVPLTPLNLSHVRAIYAGRIGKGLLRYVSRFSGTADRDANLAQVAFYVCLDRNSRHSAIRGFTMTQRPRYLRPNVGLLAVWSVSTSGAASEEGRLLTLSTARAG